MSTETAAAGGNVVDPDNIHADGTVEAREGVIDPDNIHADGTTAGATATVTPDGNIHADGGPTT